jgi:hypothetical protein
LKPNLSVRTPQSIDMDLAHFLATARYDFQSTRMASKNRLRSILIRRLEGWGYLVPEKKEDGEKSYGAEWNDEEVFEKLEKARDENTLSRDEFDYINQIWAASDRFESEEKEYEKLFVPYCERWAVWQNWLKHIKGVGKVHALNLFYLFGDCSRFDNISKLWAYCGYHVVDGVAPKRKRGQKSNWNGNARSKMWNVVQSMIRATGKPYHKMYLPLKEDALKNHPDWSKGHAHNHAIRVVAKRFLACYWIVARQDAGLPITEPYIIGREGHSHTVEPGDFAEVV